MKIFQFYSGNGIIWFSIFGLGIHIKDLNKRYLIFSERNGYSKRVVI